MGLIKLANKKAQQKQTPSTLQKISFTIADKTVLSRSVPISLANMAKMGRKTAKARPEVEKKVDYHTPVDLSEES